MPAVRFEELPADARVWVFASDRALVGTDRLALLDAVDQFLAQWQAHGAPLRSARAWRDDHFLAIGVDPTAEQASGCSIDGLFRGLRSLEQTLATTLVAGGRVFYRDAAGQPRCATRGDVAGLAGSGALTEATPVFDTSVTTAAGWRERFEIAARESWVGALMEPASRDASAHASHSSSRSATKSSSARKG